jgi:hypothetical protein
VGQIYRAFVISRQRYKIIVAPTFFWLSLLGPSFCTCTRVLPPADAPSSARNLPEHQREHDSPRRSAANCRGSTCGTQPNRNKANVLLYRMAVAVLSSDEGEGTQVAGKVKTSIDK